MGVGTERGYTKLVVGGLQTAFEAVNNVLVELGRLHIPWAIECGRLGVLQH